MMKVLGHLQYLAITFTPSSPSYYYKKSWSNSFQATLQYLKSWYENLFCWSHISSHISLLVLRELINLYAHWNHQKTNGFSKTKHEPWLIFTHSSIAFNVTFNQISHIVLVSLLLTLNKSYELFSYTFFISN